jgi:hypothetical protein
MYSKAIFITRILMPFSRHGGIFYRKTKNRNTSLKRKDILKRLVEAVNKTIPFL